MTAAEARKLLTADVRAALAKVSTEDAFAAEALDELGVPAALVRVLMVGDKAPIAKARQSATRRTLRVETTNYVWGPDVPALIKGFES